jgi:hypothetical protein
MCQITVVANCSTEASVQLHVWHIWYEMYRIHCEIKYFMITVSPCSGPDEISCMDEETRCFNNMTERCNGKMDCMSGLDEKDCGKCPGEYACHSGEGCFKVHQLCDNKADCSDYSDEMTCGKFLLCTFVCIVSLHP